MARSGNRIKVLAFDVGGTVFDWRATVREAVAEAAVRRGIDIDAGAVADAWRLRMFAVLERVRSGALGPMSTDAMQRASLRETMDAFPQLTLDAPDLDAMEA